MLLHRTEADGKRKCRAPGTLHASSSPELSGEGAGSCAGMGNVWRAKGFDNPLLKSVWSAVPCNSPVQPPGRAAVAGMLCGSLDKRIEHVGHRILKSNCLLDLMWPCYFVK